MGNVGIFSLHNHGVASAHDISYWDSACELPIPDAQYPLIPFAFLTHTHGLGIHASGWIVRNGEWTLIGEADPQDPQSFYPVKSMHENITPSDTLAIRCIMRSARDRDTLQGLSKHMEMCDYFVFYKTKGRILSDNTCTTNSTFTWNNY